MATVKKGLLTPFDQMMSTIMESLRSITLPGQMFRPKPELSHHRIVYRVSDTFVRSAAGRLRISRLGIVEFRYENDDITTPLRTISWQEWESWVETTKAVPYDHPMMYQWDINETLIVTLAQNPQAARDQVAQQYRRNYGVKIPYNLKLIDCVYPANAAVFLAYGC